MSLADHALATELVMGTLRWLSLLDHQIAQVSNQPLTKLDIEVLIALRLAVISVELPGSHSCQRCRERERRTGKAGS